MKKKVILVSRDGRPSMRTVYRQMQSGQLDIVRTPRRGNRYIRRYTGNEGDSYTKTPIAELACPNSVVIRWGNRIPVDTDEHTVTYNKCDALKAATNKKESREIFMREGVRTSRLVTPDTITRSQYPVIARPFTHSKGRNFVTISVASAFRGHYNENNSGWYYSEFIDKEREFRVHCAHGKVLDVMEKPKATGIAWNRAQNHEAFVRVKQADYIHDVCLQALKATKALGLDFAGVDVLLKDDLAYVLEANTSPTLNSSEHVSARYARYFDWLFRSETRREHFDFTAWKKADSFAWKNDQLSA
jgi:hypothetical protein